MIPILTSRLKKEFFKVKNIDKGACHRQKIPVKIIDFYQKSDVLEIDV